MSTEPTDAASALAQAWQKKVSQFLKFAAQDVDLHALADQTAPVFESILEARRVQSDPDATEIEHREAGALVMLLGRRFAEVRIAPMLALSAFFAFRDTAREAGASFSDAAYASLSGLFVDGFVRGTEDAARDAALDAVADSHEIVRCFPGCLLLALRGDIDPHVTERLATRLGRLLLREETRSLILAIPDLQSRDGAALRVLTPLIETCDAMGVRSAFVCSPDIREQIQSVSGISPRHSFARDVPSALRECLADSGNVIVPLGPLARSLGRFRAAR